MAENRPSIKIFVNAEFQQLEAFYSVFFGIEEEGIPYEAVNSEERNSVKLAYNAALTSRLDVGLGIGVDGSIIMHYAKLKENSPLFKSNFRAEESELRMFGANAARLVKGMPFKSEGE